MSSQPSDLVDLLGQAALDWPERLVDSEWTTHVPFALWCVAALRPQCVVELGTFRGVSYCAFCQAAARFGGSTRCFAVDTWRGDEQSGTYGDEVFEELRAYHDARYAGFSTLLRETFGEASARFRDGEIDLLHVDGAHTYEAVRGDFETWMPKMSARGVMLLHDTQVRERDFGVWRLWEEVRGRHPSFEFKHGHGLGVLAVGREEPAALRPLLDAPPERAAAILGVFERLGEGVRLKREASALKQHADLLEREIATAREYMGRLEAEAARTRDVLDEIERSWLGTLRRIAGRWRRRCRAPFSSRRQERIQ